MAELVCQVCRNVGSGDLSPLRVKGWRYFEGFTWAGEEVRFIQCPVCSGVLHPDVVLVDPGWDAQCRTCFFTMREDWEEEPVTSFDEDGAKEWKKDHRCEPDVVIKAPKA